MKTQTKNAHSAMLRDSFERLKHSKGLSVCNGSTIPPVIRGFSGPLNYIQLQKLISNMGYSYSETYVGSEFDFTELNKFYVYYLCDDRKVLNTVTNQRFFQLPCNSSKLERGFDEVSYPICDDPTHCIGAPKAW